MQLIYKKAKTIEVGDLVSYESQDCSYVCLVTADAVSEENEFPFELIDTKTLMKIDGYATLENINKYCSLIAKSKDLRLMVEE